MLDVVEVYVAPSFEQKEHYNDMKKALLGK